MDIQQLRAVLRVAEHGSFTKSARESGVSQPAISQQIARLEAELGRAVFERKGRHVKLTEAGEIFHRRAEEIVALADDTTRLLADDGESGKVIVSAIPTIAPYLLPRVLSDFHKRHPRAQIVVNEEVTEVILRRCKSGEIDVGVLALPVEQDSLRFEPLFEEELLLVLPKDHALTERKKISIEDLREEPFVMLDEAHCLSNDIRTFCRRKMFQPFSAGKTSQISTVQELVSLGHGVSLIPEMARKLDHNEGRVYRSLHGAKPMRTVAICWNPERYRSRLADRFVELLRANHGARGKTKE